MSSSDAWIVPRRLGKPSGRRLHPADDHGSIFHVHRVTYEPPLAHDVFIADFADWCNVLAETPDGELVFVWQHRFGSDALSLEVPGGVIDEGEAPLDAARRELREETGYEADTFELVSVVEPNPALQGNRCFTYLARDARATGQTAFDELEDLETVLVPKSAIACLLDDGIVTHALVVVALETYLRKHAVRADP